MFGMGGYHPQDIFRDVYDSIHLHPPYALFENKIGKREWTLLDPAQIAAYAHIVIYYKQDPNPPAFASYDIVDDTNRHHSFKITSGKAFILDNEDAYHQILQISPRHLQEEINNLPQIVTRKNFLIK